MKEDPFIPIEDYAYKLPGERIARYPLADRDASKLLIYQHGKIRDTIFSEIDHLIPPGTRLFFNNTRVIHARLQFEKETGAKIEIFCLSPHSPPEYQISFSQNRSCTWKCLVGNLKKWKSGKLAAIHNIGGKMVELSAMRAGTEGNSVLIEFEWSEKISFGEILDHIGRIPIPPYLERDSEEIDNERYQTIYSALNGSVAAPTAGLHFTPGIMENLRLNKVDMHEVTLHVGAGTFQPVKSGNAMQHEMHSEFFSVDVKTIQNLSGSGELVIATGTTTLRTLESLYWLAVKSVRNGRPAMELKQWEDKTLPDNIPVAEAFTQFSEMMVREEILTYSARTGIMIVPGYRFKTADALITNFHQPASTLLLLVAAFIGNDWKNVYDYALRNNFRFLSYGDSSLLFRKEN